MASVYHLYSDALQVKQFIVDKYSEHAEANKISYFAAVKIQRNWRGYAVRKEIKRWNHATITIQRYYRGWIIRWHLPETYKEYYEELTRNHFDRMATKIQALWHGYQVRKIIYMKDLIAQRQDLENITKSMNDLLINLFDQLKFAEDLESPTYRRKCMERILKSIFDRHHLLRTYQIEGVLSLHGSRELSKIEQILKSMKYTKYTKVINEFMGRYKDLLPPEADKANRRFNLSGKIKEKPYEKLLHS